MTKATANKWYQNITKVLVVAFVEVGFFVGFRSMVQGDPIATTAVGLALVYLTAKELL